VGEFRCVGPALYACAGANTWVELEVCDPLLGLTCDPGGTCTGVCNWSLAAHIGCDYYPATTAHDAYVFLANDFAVTIANPGPTPATVTVTYDGDVIAAQTVAVGALAVMELPAITDLSSNLESGVIHDAAYRLRATAPVTVHQFSPDRRDVTNDAVLLLPVNAWGHEYVVASWPHWESFNERGMFAVVASEDATTVKFSPPGGGTPTRHMDGVDASGHGQVVLDAGDVVQLFTRRFGDFTGMRVSADRPVQVLGGHACTAVPDDSFACDKLEEAMLPVGLLGSSYTVVPPARWPGPGEKPIFVRIIAAEDAATLSFTPPQPAPDFLANAGDFVQLGPTTASFVVTSDRKLMVALYMVSEEFGQGSGDPSMVLAIPAELHSDEYLVHAHPSWDVNFADIVAPTGALVHVDGTPVVGFTAITGTGLGYAHVALASVTDGVHRIVGDRPIGLSVYGMSPYGSYWYPGGLTASSSPAPR